MSGIMKSSLLHLGYRSVAEARQTDHRQLVHSALEKFDQLRLLFPQTGAQPFQVLSLMRKKFPRFFLNQHYKQGSPLGLEVGDYFSFRAELCVVGLHRPTQAGIDWIEITMKGGNKTTMAVSIVVSGAYEDDLDSGETLIYTGEGGNDLKSSRKQREDQKLMRGTEALYNSKFLQNPVRVIRARGDDRSLSGKFHSYDGLYKVVDFKKEKGKSGFDVYRFTLVREPGQKLLNWLPPPFGYSPNSWTVLRDLQKEHEERDQSTECGGLKAFLGPAARNNYTVPMGRKGDGKRDVECSIGGGGKSEDTDGDGNVHGFGRYMKRRFEEDVSGAVSRAITDLGDGKACVVGRRSKRRKEHVNNIAPEKATNR